MQFGSVRNRLMIACAVTALTLSGCDKDGTQKNTSENSPAAAAVAPPEAALPLATGAAPSGPPAPAAAALPPAPPLRYDGNTGDRYAYLDRAYTAAQAFGDAPPDYTYSYEQQQPLAWRSDDGYERVAEQLPDSGMRYYYYQPGAEEPYLVQDPEYSYGYSDGVLTVVYDADGNILSDELAQRQAGIAARYFARARALYAASVEEHHEAVAQAAWDLQQERIYADQQRWREQQDRDADWRAYHYAHLQNEQAHWAMERYRRAAETARFAQTINNAVIDARAAQALSDASAQARRYGHEVAPLAASAPPARPSPAVSDHGAPSSSGPGTEPPRGSDAQRQSPAPGTNSRSQNLPAAPAQAAAQHGPTSPDNHIGEPVTTRPGDARAQVNREHERSAEKPLTPTTAVPVGNQAKAPVTAPPSTPVLQHAAPTVPADHVGNNVLQNRPILTVQPATPPKAPTNVMSATSAAKPATLPVPLRAAPIATPQQPVRSDQKPTLFETRSASKGAHPTVPNAVPTRLAQSAGSRPPNAAPTKATPQPSHVTAHVARGTDNHKRPLSPENKKDEPTPP
jgi:hypothetical protein